LEQSELDPKIVYRLKLGGSAFTPIDNIVIDDACLLHIV
jgi:hypothetical protein